MIVSSVSQAFLNAWNVFVTYLPQFLGAVVILVVGIIIAYLAAAIVRRIVKALGADAYLNHSETYQKIGAAGFSLADILAGLVRWFIILAFLIPTANALGVPQITTFLNQVALYIPNVVAAVFILAAGMLLADFLANVVAASLINERARVLGRGIMRYSVVTFSVMAALIELRIAPHLIEILFAGAVLAVALAFGLGGREHARDLISEIRGLPK